MSLYRKYRPKTFADVVGQDHIVSTLSQAVEQDKLAHAYLFAGTRGTGKTSTARILSKILLTRGVQDEKIKEQIIEAVDDGNLVDLTEIDAASNTGVDNIRDLIEKIQFTPVVAGAKVYIIDEVHMLSKGAFNALLKTLEEPPAYAYFILATTELHKIPATIQSRCQRFLFRQINESDISGRLRYISDQEDIKAEDEALMAIAHHVQGGMRDAISLLDQLRSLPEVTLRDVKERVGETGHEYVEQVLAAIAGGDREAILKVTRLLEETGVPMENFLRLLLDTVRTQLHTAVQKNQSTAAFEPVLNTLLQTVKDLRSSPLPGLVLESALLSLCNGGPSRPAPSIPHVSPPAPTPPSPAPATPPKAQAPSAPAPSAPPAPAAPEASAPTDGAVTLKDVKAKWTEVVQLVEPPSAKMSLKNAQVHAIDGSTLILRFSSSFHRDKASSPEGGRNLEVALQKTLGKPMRVKCVLESDVHAPPPIANEENVDLAAAALDVF
jgi:DNA polymerase-3 subunit gamma/tau